LLDLNTTAFVATQNVYILKWAPTWEGYCRGSSAVNQT